MADTWDMLINISWINEWMNEEEEREWKGREINEWGIKYGIQTSRSRKFCEPIILEMIWTKIPVVGGLYFFFFFLNTHSYLKEKQNNSTTPKESIPSVTREEAQSSKHYV